MCFLKYFSCTRVKWIHTMILVANLNMDGWDFIYISNILFFGVSLKFYSVFHENNDKY